MNVLSSLWPNNIGWEIKQKTKCFSNKKTLNAVSKQPKPKLIVIHEDKKTSLEKIILSQWLNLLKCFLYLKENLNLH
jgi:hypothetical protein